MFLREVFYAHQAWIYSIKLFILNCNNLSKYYFFLLSFFLNSFSYFNNTKKNFYSKLYIICIYKAFAKVFVTNHIKFLIFYLWTIFSNSDSRMLVFTLIATLCLFFDVVCSNAPIDTLNCHIMTDTDPPESIIPLTAL